MYNMLCILLFIRLRIHFKHINKIQYTTGIINGAGRLFFFSQFFTSFFVIDSRIYALTKKTSMLAWTKCNSIQKRVEKEATTFSNLNELMNFNEIAITQIIKHIHMNI